MVNVLNFPKSIFRLFFVKKAAILDFFIFFQKSKYQLQYPYFIKEPKKHTMPRLRESSKSISSFFIAFSFIFTLLHWNMAAILFFNFFQKHVCFKNIWLHINSLKNNIWAWKFCVFRQNPWIFSVFPLFSTKNGGHLGFLQKNLILKFFKHVYSTKWHFCKISCF